MYSIIKVKNEIFSKALLIRVIIALSSAFILCILGKSLEAPLSFKVSIVDEDKTVLSAKTAEDIGSLSGVSVTDKDADIRYVIKKGFAGYFKKGEFNSLIDVEKNSFKQGVSLLNDRIATKLVSNYIYLNLYERINSSKKMSFEDYDKSLSGTRFENEILTVRVNDRKISSGLSEDVDILSYIVMFFITFFSMNIGLSQVVKLNRIRNNQVLDRLKLSGVNECCVIFNELIVSSLKTMAVIVPFMIIKTDIKIYFIAILLFYLNLIVNFILERTLKSEAVLVIMARGAMILFLAAGMFINFYF